MRAAYCSDKPSMDETTRDNFSEGNASSFPSSAGSCSKADGRVMRLVGRETSRPISRLALIACLLAISWSVRNTDAFRTSHKTFNPPRLLPSTTQSSFMSVTDDEDVGEGKSQDDDRALFGEDLDTGGVIMEDLSWRVERMRLEEQNTNRFLKSRPIFLPYDECRRWVQAFGRWDTEEDWKQWISMGEKRNSYIPSKPDEYYSQLGQW